MDPISAVGLALSVASLAGQVLAGCIQGIQLVITAMNVPEDSKYFNLRLRMEQQRLFAWSETSGLVDVDDLKIRESNIFVIHRTTILDLLVQIQCLFKEFEKAQMKNKHLKIAPESVADEDTIEDPAKDSSSAHVPLSESRRRYIIKVMKALKSNTSDQLAEGRRRLWWAAFDKAAFEVLLQRFSTLNDNMTDILDARLQTEIHRTTQDTNRGVLQLHKDLNSLHRLVMALNIKLESKAFYTPSISHENSEDNSSGLKLLAQLAKFKAFNEAINPSTGSETPWDEATGEALSLGKPYDEKTGLQIEKSNIKFVHGKAEMDIDSLRCEATYVHDGIEEPVWIEWKDYDYTPGATSPPPLIIDRVQKLAALLHHEPKPEAFRVPHCLGYFDNLAAAPSSPLSLESEEFDDDSAETRIGLVFRKPPSTISSPVSLFQLFTAHQKPRVTDRIKLAHSLSNCLLYLHSVNWLHKGFRSHNIVFFPTTEENEKRSKIAWGQAYLSGFDFARPARKDEMTETPGDSEEYNMYRHPGTQGVGWGPRESYRKSFDIYSFGIVLVELCFWKSITDIISESTQSQTRTSSPTKKPLAKNVRSILMSEEMLLKIGGEMGEVVEEVVKRCIIGGKELGVFDGEDEMGDEKVVSRLGMSFFERVVKRLGDINV
ncbi:hypothetical protein ACMFMF_002119 [Clarireedia jacksonii]